MYTVTFRSTDGSGSAYDTFIRDAGVTVKSPGAASQLFGKTFSGQGKAPARPQGSRITYSQGARGPTPNVPEYAVESLAVLFNEIIVPTTSAAAEDYYLTEGAFYFLQAMGQAFSVRPDLASDKPMLMVIRRLLQGVTPEQGIETASRKFSNVETYTVIPTYCGHGDNGVILTVDVISKQLSAVENYKGGDSTAAPGGR